MTKKGNKNKVSETDSAHTQERSQVPATQGELKSQKQTQKPKLTKEQVEQEEAMERDQQVKVFGLFFHSPKVLITFLIFAIGIIVVPVGTYLGSFSYLQTVPDITRNQAQMYSGFVSVGVVVLFMIGYCVVAITDEENFRHEQRQNDLLTEQEQKEYAQKKITEAFEENALENGYKEVLKKTQANKKINETTSTPSQVKLEPKKKTSEEQKKASEKIQQILKPEENKKQAEETQQKAEETKKQAEKSKQKAEVIQKKAEETIQKAEVSQKKADEVKKNDEDQKKKAEEIIKKAQEAKKKADETIKKTEQAKEQVEQIKEKVQETKGKTEPKKQAEKSSTNKKGKQSDPIPSDIDIITSTKKKSADESDDWNQVKEVKKGKKSNDTEKVEQIRSNRNEPTKTFESDDGFIIVKPNKKKTE